MPAKKASKPAAKKPGSGGKAVAKPSSGKARKQAQSARRSASKRTDKKTTTSKRGKKRMTGKKHDDDEHAGSKHEQDRDRNTSAAERRQRDEQGKEGVYRDPVPGSTQPSQTTMANPGPENKPFEPEEPTDDPMATPQHSTLPNPPSPPGGAQTGDPNTTPTGERLPEDHPDYKHVDVDPPDHRSQAEKEADPHRGKSR